MIARKTLLSLACLLLLIAGCDQSSIPNTQEEPGGNTQSEQSLPFQTTSASHLGSEAPAARKLRSFLERTGKPSVQEIYWKRLKIINMEVNGYESEVSVVIAPIQDRDSSHISVLSTSDTHKRYPVNYSQLIYIPSLGKSFTADWHRTVDPASEKWSGFVRFDMEGGGFTHKVKDGLPIKKVDLEGLGKYGEDQSEDESDCLDCGTGECYRTAKDACDNNGDCKLLCDVLDVAGGQCTLSIAAACFVYNNT